jgi:hypothetical protein
VGEPTATGQQKEGEDRVDREDRTDPYWHGE